MVVHIIAVLRSKKSFGVVPHSTMPVGMHFVLCAEVDPELQRLDHLWLVVGDLGAGLVHQDARRSAWSAPGTASRESRRTGSRRPHCVTLPDGIALGQLLAEGDQLVPVGRRLFGIEARPP